MEITEKPSMNSFILGGHGPVVPWKTHGKRMENIWKCIYIYVYMWKITTIQTSMIYAVMICYDSYDNANKKWT
jgi:hypothetical protein